MRWHTADFDALDWHGVHVHGWRIVERGPGEADLLLDIDWILAGPQPADGQTGFVVAQAMLAFHEVSALRFVLDYAACSAASGPFSIETLHREALASPVGGPDEGDADWREEAAVAAGPQDHGSDDDGDDYGPWRWRIDLAWPEGELVFEASGFSQWLVGEPQALDAPVLPAASRS